VRKILKILLIGLVLFLGVAAKDGTSVIYDPDPSYLKLDKYSLGQGDKCLWQCYRLFGRFMPPKDYSTETDNLTNCVCARYLVKNNRS
jgi:hypothetical protein